MVSTSGAEAALPSFDGAVERLVGDPAIGDDLTLLARQRAENVLGSQTIDVVELAHRSRHPFNCARLRWSHVLIVPSGLPNRAARASRLNPSR